MLGGANGSYEVEGKITITSDDRPSCYEREEGDEDDLLCWEEVEDAFCKIFDGMDEAVVVTSVDVSRRDDDHHRRWRHLGAEAQNSIDRHRGGRSQGRRNDDSTRTVIEFESLLGHPLNGSHEQAAAQMDALAEGGLEILLDELDLRNDTSIVVDFTYSPGERSRHVSTPASLFCYGVSPPKNDAF